MRLGHGEEQGLVQSPAAKYLVGPRLKLGLLVLVEGLFLLYRTEVLVVKSTWVRVSLALSPGVLSQVKALWDSGHKRAEGRIDTNQMQLPEGWSSAPW